MNASNVDARKGLQIPSWANFFNIQRPIDGKFNSNLMWIIIGFVLMLAGLLIFEKYGEVWIKFLFPLYLHLLQKKSHSSMILLYLLQSSIGQLLRKKSEPLIPVIKWFLWWNIQSFTVFIMVISQSLPSAVQTTHYRVIFNLSLRLCAFAREKNGDDIT